MSLGFRSETISLIHIMTRNIAHILSNIDDRRVHIMNENILLTLTSPNILKFLSVFSLFDSFLFFPTHELSTYVTYPSVWFYWFKLKSSKYYFFESEWISLHLSFSRPHWTSQLSINVTLSSLFVLFLEWSYQW